MNKTFLALGALIVGAVFFAAEADAKRFGGGRTVGTQRNVTPQQAAPAPKAPQAAPGQQAAPQAAPAGSRWAGILGGLAIGGMLGYLFGGSGLMGALLVAGLVLLAVMGISLLMRGRAARPAAAMAAGPAGMQVPVAPEQAPMSVASRFPAGFDAEGFLRGAKMNFVKLQLANDRGDLEEIREFTTPELFEALEADVRAGAGRQQTDISGLEARVLDVATEGGRYWVSVAFNGAEPEPFSEVWNLTKPVDGSSGWLLAGIQQMH